MKSTRIKKETVLEKIAGTYGIVANIAKRLGVDWKTVDNYRKRWPEVEEAIRSERGKRVGLAESSLVRMVRDGDYRSVALVLERLGGKEWAPSRQVDITTGGEPLRPVVIRFTSREDGGDGAGGE